MTEIKKLYTSEEIKLAVKVAFGAGSSISDLTGGVVTVTAEDGEGNIVTGSGAIDGADPTLVRCSFAKWALSEGEATIHVQVAVAGVGDQVVGATRRRIDRSVAAQP